MFTGYSQKMFLTKKAGKNGKKAERQFRKYNHAYGIPMMGTDSFSDESMKRGCYLIRLVEG